VLGLPSVLWRLDGNYRALRREVPWLKHRPSEYFRRQVRMLTYPMDRGPSVGVVIAAQEVFDGLSEQVCFGSGSPLWDSSTYQEVMKRIPKNWSAKVAYENAAGTFRLPNRVP
jgi:predicted TIM-barrel fold metal-dependent hydrolase